MPFTVAEIAERVAGTAKGETQRIITGANTIENAGPGDLAFAANRKALEAAKASQAGCILVPQAFEERLPAATIRVADPRAAFAKMLESIYPRKRAVAGIHPSAVIAESAQVGRNVSVGAHACIGENSRIGEGSQIGPGCVLSDNVAVGAGSTLHAQVTIYDKVTIGARAIIHAGVVIGADGFGFALVGDHYEKFPQVGTVEIGDDVEIGANCCIDRAALGVTRIGDGTKLDNLVHVAHNCVLGKHVAVAAQTGFSGSVTVGDYAVIGSSKDRQGALFAGLPLSDRLRREHLEPWRGLYVVDLRSGNIVHWLRLEGVSGEIYNVEALPGVRRPGALDFETEQVQQSVTIGPAPLSRDG